LRISIRKNTYVTVQLNGLNRSTSVPFIYHLPFIVYIFVGIRLWRIRLCSLFYGLVRYWLAGYVITNFRQFELYL